MKFHTTFSVVMVYRPQCAHCVQLAEEQWYFVEPGWDVPWPALPLGWRVVDGQLVCPAHKVEIT